MTEPAQMRVAFILVLLILGGTISGCAAEGDGRPAEVATGVSASPEPTDAESPEAAASFVLPETCTDLTGADLEASFLAEGNVLLTAPDGSAEWGGGTIASAQTTGTPFSCWYGLAPFDSSDFEVAVQAISQGARSQTLAALEGGGFTKAVEGDVVTFSHQGSFTEIGDPANSPTVVHVLHPDSWITISTILGGAEQIARINEWLPIVTAQVYP